MYIFTNASFHKLFNQIGPMRLSDIFPRSLKDGEKNIPFPPLTNTKLPHRRVQK